MTVIPSEPRISSVEEAASLGRLVRREIATLIEPEGLEDRGYPRVSTEPHLGGTLTDAAWLTSLDLPARSAELREIFEGESYLLDVQAGALFQAWQHAVELLSDPTVASLPPLILPIRPGSKTRVGFFTFATDRDAFVGDLLGPIVPKHPRYARGAPLPDVRLAGELYDVRAAFHFGADASDLYGATPREALGRLDDLTPILDRMAHGDQARQRLLHWLVSMPEAFAQSPVGRTLLPVARGAPRWRQPRVRSELVATYDLGGMARHVGVAVWRNSVGARRLRAQMAAHLRYAFDYRVAPWNRWDSVRRRREILHLHFRGGWPAVGIEAHSIRETCAALRRRYPSEYVDEPASRTLGRLYRLSSLVGRHAVGR